MRERIAVIGLGYVGLPVALAFAAKFPGTIGFDVNSQRVNELRSGLDRSGEVEKTELTATSLRVTDNPSDLAETTFFVVAVPTPIDRNNKPDLRPIVAASETVGQVLKTGAVVVYESTVYPGLTEEICGSVLARVSGLRQHTDFKLGYSPERINPGDKDHTLAKITKIVSGEDCETLDRVAAAYGAIVPAGVHRAPSIRVAEAAKVIENTQRDLNIALMNELAVIFERLDIRTCDVLAAARTKWNFLPFSPGLVGGHCIGVDPYYLTTKAEEVGYHPQVILAGRRINDGMGAYIAQRMVKLLVHADIAVRSARIGILGLTFKENVPDMRNSRVPDIVAELRQFGIEPLIHDPIADAEEAHAEYGLRLQSWEQMRGLDGVIMAVSHQAYEQMSTSDLCACLCSGGVLVDVKATVDSTKLPAGIHYWCL